MADFSSLGGGDSSSPNYTVSPIAVGSYPAGTPVYLNGSGQAALAKADAFGTSVKLGVLRSASQAGQPADVQWGGSLTLNAAQWESVVDTAPTTGLTPGDVYYVSDATAGKLTSTKVTTADHYIVIVGVAESASSLFLISGQPALEGSA